VVVVAARLTDKQQRFVEEYLIDLNATQAAIRAGYSKKTADRIGPELLGKTCVSEAIQEAKKKRSVRTEITQDRILAEYAKVAFFDVRKMFDKDGKPLDIQNLDDDTAAALIGLDVQDVYEDSVDGKKFMGYVKKYKMADKLKALEALGRHIGLFEKQENQTDAIGTAMKALADIIKNPVQDRNIKDYEE